MPVNAKKREYAQRMIDMINDHKNIFIVEADNVGSKQMQQIRMSLRGEATVLMGKNTTMRRVLKDFLDRPGNEEHPIEQLMQELRGNVGMVFTNCDLAKVKDMLTSNRAPAPARVGAISPVDVYVEPGATGCDPGQTSWFQALNIATKINRGQIEIVSRVHLVKEGEKVSDSQAALLQKLNILPFSYGLSVTRVYSDGVLIDPKVLDLTDDQLRAKLLTGIRTLAAASMQLGYPTKASLVHSINYAYKAVLSVGLGTDYKFPAVKAFEDFFANPGAFAPAAAADTGAAAEQAAPEEESEEESVGGAGGLFGDESEDDW